MTDGFQIEFEPGERKVLPLTKGNSYFIVLDQGEVYQAEYCGYHAHTSCYWFKPLGFRQAVDGPQWVFYRRLRALWDLGRPYTGEAFDMAIESILQ